NQPLDHLRVEDAMDIPLAAPTIVGHDDKGEGDHHVGNCPMYVVMFVLGMGIVLERGSMTTQNFKNLLRQMKRRLFAFSMNQIDLLKIIFFRKKQYFTIQSMLKTMMFAWDSADLCIVSGPIAGAEDYLLRMIKVFDKVFPEELIESVGSCSGGVPT
ncbi:unnamed protein product, partial [Ilex paraguariensis]